MDVIAEGLDFPEGPVIMADGSIILVEIHSGKVTRCWDGKKETICETGGGPNGAAYGPDGAIWVCNNGGLGASGPGTEGRIERVDLTTGKFERIYDACDGIALSAPNDLVFDSSGRLWFTDMGTIRDNGKDFGGAYSCTPDGDSITAIKSGAMSYNGIGLSPDESQIYVADTFQARVYRFDAKLEAQEPDFVATGPGPVAFDSLAMTEAGNICVAMVFGGGIASVTPGGEVSVRRVEGDDFVTNIAFGGEDMCDAYITQSGIGKLVRLRWDEPGLRLAFNG